MPSSVVADMEYLEAEDRFVISRNGLIGRSGVPFGVVLVTKPTWLVGEVWPGTTATTTVSYSAAQRWAYSGH